jgi:hypothetical protein
VSLKAFHVLFIAAATVLAGGLGVWCLREHAAASDGAGTIACAVASFAAAAGLVAYGTWFLRKVKGL